MTMETKDSRGPASAGRPEQPAAAEAPAPGTAGLPSSPAVPGERKTAAPGAAAAEENRKLLDQLTRLKADYENFRKRVDREKPELIRHGRDELLGKLFPLYDVLLAAHEQVARHEREASTKELGEGLELIFKEFTKVFETEGVSVIKTVGEPYDFHKHDALGHVETDAYPEGTVAEEIQRGYLLDGKTLRPAKVRISKAKRTA